MNWGFVPHRSFTTVQSLTISNVPKGAKIKVSCTGHRCPFKQYIVSHHVAVRPRCKHNKHCHNKKTPPHAYADDLTRLFAQRHLAVKTTITVAVVQPNTNSKLWLFRIRANKQPTDRISHALPAT